MEIEHSKVKYRKLNIIITTMVLDSEVLIL
jgi:hypothetical protein